MTELKKMFLSEIMEKGKEANLGLFEKEDLYDLADWSDLNGFTTGIVYGIPSINGYRSMKPFRTPPRLTLQGKEYLNSLNTPKINEPIKMELVGEAIDIFKKLNNNQQEFIKIMSQNVKIFEEIAFLEADKTSIMKEELVNLRDSNSEKNIPWDTLINLMSLIINAVPKA